MRKLKSFLVTTLLGGLVVILPVTIVAAVFNWLYGLVTDWIQPITDLVVAKVGLGKVVADLVVIATIVLFCFLVGLAVRTQVGRFVHEKLESKVLKVAPGYRTVRETVLQFLGRKKSPYSRVALVQIYGSDALATAFITDEHEDGSYTVFVPTAPNPTSGLIFHLHRELVHPVKASIEEAMRSVIACGAGSRALLEGYKHSRDERSAS